VKEYTILGVISVVFTFVIAGLLKIGIFKKKIFWFFILIIMLFKFMVNGYLTGSNIVRYNQQFFIGFRLGSIPLEDFLFGFSMVSLSIIFWEYFKKGVK
jgi:lycopene cyclase domain-containing protein